MTSAALRRVQQRAVPARQLLCAVNHLRPAHLSNFVNGATLALPNVLTEQGLEQLGPVAVIYHNPVTEESSGPVEVCVPYQGELKLPHGLTQRHDLPHREAYLPLTKREFTDSALFNRARSEVERYARANGDVLGPLRQIDYGVWNTRGETEVVGELALPLRWFNQLRPETRGRLFP
ncbi:hypothetical protein DKM44_03095 [Deinococcus irradiatisoli]|uniref:Uncharacterized protein n=1 Tax=Deinococcus irradiatisoli TaxID=2202254 RepID=A0A2Z3JB30_9DEIO|nr:hypothetical protein [Deinococcus irradiatisoli]AWN22347.1 hypothetical protein DKM44_03095 [Deinococcus irradiatisoli]